MSTQNYIEIDRKRFTEKQENIRAALNDLNTGMINGITEESKKDVFYMLCFCLLVPQSKQTLAEKAIEKLKEKDFLNVDMSVDDICDLIHGKVRYQNTKSRRLFDARILFKDGFWDKLKSRWDIYKDSEDRARDRCLLQTRRWLTDSVNGMGLKLASHFMRNTGMRGLAILDIHVLRALEERLEIGLDWHEKDKGLPTLARPLSKDEYFVIESKMKKYAKEGKFDLDELDLLFWSNETGYVGK